MVAAVNGRIASVSAVSRSQTCTSASGVAIVAAMRPLGAIVTW